MASRLEKLLMRVELIDKVTGTANRIGSSLEGIQKRVEAGYVEILKGVGGLWGAGVALTSLTSDYHDMHRAMGEVASLSVADDALKQLEKTALNFSIKYGESATDFVRSAYDIQSAIAGLTGGELSKFTEASNVLAKGTKAAAATITNYMGTMYGIFKTQADAMGKSQWVQQLTGQTAQAVEMFKTDGSKMSQAFTALGSNAANARVPIEEQIAVLGALSATMEGGAAGTKYTAFLAGVGKAQEKLGLKFTDSQNRMLPMVDILEKIKTKFPDLSVVADSDLLEQAFGSREASSLIKNLISDTNGLSDSINKLGSITGMEKAREMAERMTMKTDQLKQAGVAVRIGFGALVDKALMPFYDAGIKHLSMLSQWIDKYPNVFGLLAKMALWVGVVVAAVSALAIAKGAAMIAMTGFSTGLAILKFALLPLSPLINAAKLAFVMFKFQLALGTKIIPAAAMAMRVFGNSLLLSAKSAWAFTAALLSNPITWIVVGVVALIAGLVMLVTHWDSVKAAAVGAIDWMVQKWQAFRAIIEDNPVLKFIFQPLLQAADFVGFLINNLQKIPEWFGQFKDWLSNLNLFDVILAPAKYLLDLLNKIPGVKIDTSKLTSAGQAQQNAAKATPEAVQKFEQLSQPVGLPAVPAAVQAPLLPAAKAIEPIQKQTVVQVPELPKAATSVAPITQDVFQAVHPAVAQVPELPKAATSVAPITQQIVQSTTPVKAPVLAPITQTVAPVALPLPAQQPAQLQQAIEPVMLPMGNAFTTPMQMPVEANFVNTADLNLPELPALTQQIMQRATPAVLDMPAINNIQAPAPLVIPAVLKIAEPANLPAIDQLVNVIPNSIARLDNVDAEVSEERKKVAPAPDAPISSVPPGGLQQQFNNSTSNRSTHVGQVNVNTTQPFNAFSFVDQLKMVAG